MGVTLRAMTACLCLRAYNCVRWMRSGCVLCLRCARAYGCVLMGACLWPRACGCVRTAACVWLRVRMAASVWVRDHGRVLSSVRVWLPVYGCVPAEGVPASLTAMRFTTKEDKRDRPVCAQQAVHTQSL
jgi:hypothetical protein